MTAPADVLACGLDVDALAPIDLAGAVQVAALQRRFDQKYIVEVARLPQLLAALGASVHVLDVDGQRMTDYTSVYFDTADLRTYRDHVQRRRRRFKIRTRHYGEPAAAMLEVKCKGRRGQTIKHRWLHPEAEVDRFDSAAEALVAEVLEQEYGMTMVGSLAAVATTCFKRITLVDAAAMERVTIDLDLSIEANGQALRLGAGLAVVEAKSPRRLGRAARAIRSLGMRPQRVSKYCVGIAASHDDIQGNPWRPVLRRVVAHAAPSSVHL